MKTKSSLQRTRLIAIVAPMIVLVGWAIASTGHQAERYLPGAAHVAGANNTVWRTDLEVRSVGTIGARFRVDLLREGRDNTAYPSVTLEVAAGTAQRYVDVVDLLFGYDGSATLRVVTLDGDIRVTSRTYNDTPDGTFGQFIGASGPDDVFDFNRDATLIQLSASADPATGYRTNLGLVNLTDQPIDLDIYLYHADLTLIGTVGASLDAFEYDQIDNIFDRVTADAVEDGIAIVRALSSGAEYLTYASVIDNRTGDPIYLPGMANDPSYAPTTPTHTPPWTPTPELTPSATPTFSFTPTPTDEPVTVTTTEQETYLLDQTTIRFTVGSGTQSSLVLCSQGGTLTQVNYFEFSWIQGPTTTVQWMNCCSDTTSNGARLDYQTKLGASGSAVARSSCTLVEPIFAITGTEIDSGESIRVDGVILDRAVWP